MTVLYQPDLFKTLPFPSRPLCSDDLSRGVWRAPLSEALDLPYIQANPRQLIWVLIFDIDRPGAVLAWDDANLPPPTWTTKNPKNGHAHLAYALSVPVAKSDAAHMKPLRLLARIQHAMTETLGADQAYVGLITKTPMHERWQTDVWRLEPYSLDDLREWLPDDLPLPSRISKKEAIGIGRNVALFDALRAWAYKNRRKFTDFDTWHRTCLIHAEQINTFDQPLPFSEVKATSKSVAKWVWQRFSADGFSRVQAERGKRSGIARQSAIMNIQAELLL